MSLSMTAKHCKHPRKHREVFFYGCGKCGKWLKLKDLAKLAKRAKR